MLKPSRLKVFAVLLALFPALAPDLAAAFTTRLGARVAPVNAAVFEVVTKGSGNGGGSEYWCGAADYARRALGADWKSTIYIARGRGQSVTTGRRSAVQFTLDPTAAGIDPTGQSGSYNSLKIGESMTVQRANSYCDSSISRF